MGSAQGPVTSELEQARAAPEFGAQTSLAEKLLAVAIRAQNFTGSSGIAIALTEGQEMVCRANWGTSAPEVGAKLSIENSFTGLCVRTGEPLRCNDAQSDPRVDPEACRALGISAIACAPVRRGLKVIGVIAAFSDTPQAFTDKHLLILSTLSEVIVELLNEPRARPTAHNLGTTPDLAQATAIVQAPSAQPMEGPAITSVVQGLGTPTIQEAARTAQTPVDKPPQPAVGNSSGGSNNEIWPTAMDPGPAVLSKTSSPPSRIQRATPQPSKTVPAAGTAGPGLRLVKQPANPLTPDFSSDLEFGGFEADAAPRRRWLVPAAVLAIFAILAAAGWRLHASRKASAAKAASTVTAPVEPAPLPPVSEPSTESTPVAVEQSHPAPAPSPKLAPVKAAPPKKAVAEEPAEVQDVTIRHAPEPVVEGSGPVRRPASTSQTAEAQAPQLALPAPDLPAALAKPAPAAVVGPVSRVVPAQLSHRVEPPYPDAARRMGLSGRIVMKATITKAGTVSSVQWVSGNAMFRDTTVAAVKQWRYKPASLNGQPVESDLEIVLQFKGSANQ